MDSRNGLDPAREGNGEAQAVYGGVFCSRLGGVPVRNRIGAADAGSTPTIHSNGADGEHRGCV
ncbi:hypothetical protein D3C75_1255310 [compost metagenome]